MIPEKDESWLRRKARKYTRNILSTIRRSWTIKTLKHEYGSIVITLLGVAVAFLCLFTFSRAERWILNEKIVIAPGITWVRTAFAKENSELPKSTQDKIRAAFGVHADTFLKIAMAESGQQAGNKGYNCIYGGKSMACKPEDRAKAWSVDCGLLMINVHGTMCPTELFDIDLNIKAAQGKFQRQSFGAWSVCRTKVKCK